MEPNGSINTHKHTHTKADRHVRYIKFYCPQWNCFNTNVSSSLSLSVFICMIMGTKSDVAGWSETVFLEGLMHSKVCFLLMLHEQLICWGSKIHCQTISCQLLFPSFSENRWDGRQTHKLLYNKALLFYYHFYILCCLHSSDLFTKHVALPFSSHLAYCWLSGLVWAESSWCCPKLCDFRYAV